VVLFLDAERKSLRSRGKGKEERGKREEGRLSGPPCISYGGLESPPSVIQFSISLREAKISEEW